MFIPQLHLQSHCHDSVGIGGEDCGGDEDKYFFSNAACYSKKAVYLHRSFATYYAADIMEHEALCSTCC